MTNALPITVAIILGSLIITSAIRLAPSDFERCVAVISDDIEHNNATATLDPRDVRAQAAKICSGYNGP